VSINAPLAASHHVSSIKAPERTPEAMQVLYERCCGLDVHQKTVVACMVMTALDGQVHKPVRTFATTTASLLSLDEGRISRFMRFYKLCGTETDGAQ
jgi:ketosteroid isomerase-like protein